VQPVLATGVLVIVAAVDAWAQSKQSTSGKKLP
jgi:hypothetical protein